MKQLFLIRNDIEHNDATPPDKPRCTELLDVVWYFLKSTDSLVRIMKTEIDYELFDDKGYATAYGYNISLDYENLKKVSFSGWFPNEYLSYELKKDFIKVEVEEIHGPEKWRNTEYHKNKIDSDKWISGSFIFFPMI